MSPSDGIQELKYITADLQEVIEKHVGTDFVNGRGTPAERATAVSNGIVAATMLLQKLVAVAIMQKLEKAPADPVECQKFVDKMVADVTKMLHQRMDAAVAESMEQIAMAVLTDVGRNPTEH